MDTTAIFVDFENICLGVPKTLSQIDTSLNILRQLITACDSPIILRAYADWSRGGSVVAGLTRIGYKPVNVLGVRGKNSADIELCLDCYETVIDNDKIGTVLLVSNDRDFLPLVHRLLANYKMVRIASYRRLVSQDLLSLTQTHPRVEFVDLDQYLPARDIEMERDDTGRRMALAMKAVVQADRRFNGEVYLVPFLKDYLNAALYDETNDQRKAVLGALQESGAISIEQREDGTGKSQTYSVLVPNREHELFIQAAKRLDAAEQTLKAAT